MIAINTFTHYIGGICSKLFPDRGLQPKWSQFRWKSNECSLQIAAPSLH